MPAERTPRKPHPERRRLTGRQFDEKLDKTLSALGVDPSSFDTPAAPPRASESSPLMPVFMAPGEAPLATTLPDTDTDPLALSLDLPPKQEERLDDNPVVLVDRILPTDPFRGTANIQLPPEAEKPVKPKDVPIQVVAATPHSWDLGIQPDKATQPSTDRLSVIPDVTFHADAEVKESAERTRSVGDKIRRLGEKALMNYAIMRIVGARNYFEFGRAERKEKRREAYDRTIIKIGDALLRITDAMNTKLEARKAEKEIEKRKAVRRKELRKVLIDKKVAEIKANSPVELAKKAARERIPEARRASL